MKMKWEEPSIEVQKFVPDEYVSACWKVACAVNAANAYESEHNNSALHREGNCGAATNQWVRDRNNDGVADAMTETGTDGLGNLTCVLYADASYKTGRDYSTVKPGNYIYWTTSASGGRVWHHQGTVEGTDSRHPNRS